MLQTIYALNGLMKVYLRANGFRYHSHREVPYWFRPGSLTLSHDDGSQSIQNIDDKDVPALAFVHGIGIGLSAYIQFIRTLLHHTNRGIDVSSQHTDASAALLRPCVFLFELPHVSQCLYQKRGPSKKEMMHAIDGIFDHHRVQSAAWIAHSLGSTILTWLISSRRHLVSHAYFVDPICFLL